MNLDLFAESDRSNPVHYIEAFQGWLAEAGQAGMLHRESSVEVYEHMWSALTAWAVGQGVAIADISASDLDAYLQSRGGSGELSARYAWRLVRLVERVLANYTRTHGLAPNYSATELIGRRPDIRYANSSETEQLPDFLPASEAKLLVTFLSAVRPRQTAAGQPWQEVRNRASVALMLGAGLTPGEVRALELADVVRDGGNAKSVPWKLRVAGNGNSPARETPVAAWAGQLLRYWLEVRAEQGIPGSMVFPSTKSTGKPWGKVAQYNAAKEVLRAAR
jgi:integrase